MTPGSVSACVIPLRLSRVFSAVLLAHHPCAKRLLHRPLPGREDLTDSRYCHLLIFCLCQGIVLGRLPVEDNLGLFKVSPCICRIVVSTSGRLH